MEKLGDNPRGSCYGSHIGCQPDFPEIDGTETVEWNEVERTPHGSTKDLIFSIVGGDGHIVEAAILGTLATIQD